MAPKRRPNLELFRFATSCVNTAVNYSGRCGELSTATMEGSANGQGV
jgi:hypothetical protein